MMNENQRRILAEAVKHGGTNTSKIEQMAKTINEEVLAEARRMGKIGSVAENTDKIKLVKEMGSKTLYQYGFNYYIVSYSSMGGETAIFMADSSGKPKSYESLWSERRSVDHDSAIKDFVKGKFKKDAVVESTEIAEEPVLTGGEAAPTLFGWSKHQFEAKFRELLTRMGFERGIIHIKTEGQEMKMYFANAAKARDFVVAFNGLARRKSMGSVASVATQFNKIKSPTGTNAIVSLDLSMVRGESLDLDGTDLYEWFSEESETITEGYERKILNYLEDAGFKKGDAWFENGILYVAERHLIARAKTALKKQSDIYKLPQIKLDPHMKEETVSEGGVKAALEDFMYDLPKAAIADLKKIGMGDPKKTFNAPKSVGFGRDHKQVMGPNNTIILNIERVLQKHKIPLQFMGTPTWKIIVDYFDTFHGESVEVNEENLNIGTYGFRIDRDSGKFVLYQLSYNRGSVRFPDGRTGTVIGRYATRDEAIAAAKRQAGVKEEVGVTKQLANYRAFHARTGQQITVQASSTKEAEAKAVEALKAANKKSVYVRYLGPVKEEVEVTESIDVQTAKRRFGNFQYKKSSKTVSGDNTEFVLHGVKENELRSIFGAPKSSGGMKQWSFEHDRPLDHQFTIEFDGSDAYINSSRKGNPTVRDHIKGVFGLMGLRVTTESVEEDGEELTEAQQVIGKYRFTSFTEGSVKGWLISVQGMGEVGFVSEPAKRNTKMSVAPHQVFFHQSFQGAGNPSLMANFYPGTETRVPNEKEVRFAPRQLLKAVAMWMDKYGYEKIEHAKKEDVDGHGEEISEYYRRAGFRSSSYSGDPRWITAKYAGVDAKGRPFKKGDRVLYFPNGKKFYTGPEAEKAWLEFLSAKGDEEGMPFAR